jgi:hypothetical protein
VKAGGATGAKSKKLKRERQRAGGTIAGKEEVQRGRASESTGILKMTRMGNG